jgi:hypothetical protein
VPTSQRPPQVKGAVNVFQYFAHVVYPHMSTSATRSPFSILDTNN